MKHIGTADSDAAVNGLRRDSVLVSVVIPTHNRAPFLPRCLESALAQTHQNLEVIVVDDGSTDASMDVLQRYRDPRVRIVSVPSRRGGPAARNRGLEKATGRFVAFLDSDDEWLPHKTERQLDAFEAERPGLVYTGMWIDDGVTRRAAAAEPHGRVFEAMLSYRGPITTTGLMIDRDVVGYDLYWDEALPTMDDRDLLLRVSRRHPIARIPEPLYVRYLHDGPRMTSAEHEARAREMIIERYAEDLARRPRLAAFHYFRLALTKDRAGDSKGARASIASATKSDPANVRLRLLNAAGWLGPRALSVALKTYVALGSLRRGGSTSSERWPTGSTEAGQGLSEGPHG